MQYKGFLENLPLDAYRNAVTRPEHSTVVFPRMQLRERTFSHQGFVVRGGAPGRDAPAGLKFGRASEKGNQGNQSIETSLKASPLLDIRQMQKGNFEVMYR